jgi:hypothetical protein
MASLENQWVAISLRVTVRETFQHALQVLPLKWTVRDFIRHFVCNLANITTASQLLGCCVDHRILGRRLLGFAEAFRRSELVDMDLDI